MNERASTFHTDPSGRYVFTPGNSDGTIYQIAETILTPLTARFNRENRKEINAITEAFLAESLKGFKHPGLRPQERNAFSYLQNPKRHNLEDENNLLNVLASHYVDPNLPNDQIQQRLLNDIYVYPYITHIFNMFTNQKRAGSPALNRLEQLLITGKTIRNGEYHSENLEVDLSDIAQRYIVAGINEGVSITLSTLKSIPPALRIYHQQKGLKEPSNNDFYQFAANQGLSWIRMHSTFYKESFFSFFHQAMDFKPDESVVKADFKKPYLAIVDNPKLGQPTLAYDLNVMDKDEANYLNFFFSQVVSGPRTLCPAYKAGLTNDFYSTGLDIVSGAHVFGY